jgi:ectoine hydroxylase
MELTEEQLSFYEENGFLFLENLFSAKEVQILLSELPELFEQETPRKILEKTGVVRSFFAPDHTNDVYKCLTRLEKLVVPSQQIVKNDVYIHQTKINSKQALLGDWWEWHQDFTFWHEEDGISLPHMVTAMVFLNEVNEFNGPMLVVPGSHKAGIVSQQPNAEIESDGKWFSEYQNSTPYMSQLTANLKYTLSQKLLARWVDKQGIISVKGPVGSVLFFHGSIFHASSNNLSPWDRNTFLVTYNSVDNVPIGVENPRPDFLAGRDYRRLQPEPDHALMEFSQSRQFKTV